MTSILRSVSAILALTFALPAITIGAQEGPGSSRQLAATPSTLPNQLLSVLVRDAVWDSTRGRLFATVGFGDPKWPNTVLIVNPDTAQVEDSISVVDTPRRIAISSDGQYLFVGIDALQVVRRYHLPSHTPDLDISMDP